MNPRTSLDANVSERKGHPVVAENGPVCPSIPNDIVLGAPLPGAASDR